MFENSVLLNNSTVNLVDIWKGNGSKMSAGSFGQNHKIYVVFAKICATIMNFPLENLFNNKMQDVP